ncbi:FMN-binding protein [uncultured Amnibacterium sp.]|uniref:FMN-binding protein n=1 Tax=uncultured Amnibacterium sp. TaxID=1631851 RepID=UPI0035CB2E0D
MTIRPQHAARAASAAALAAVAIGVLASCSSQTAAGETGSGSAPSGTSASSDTASSSTSGSSGTSSSSSSSSTAGANGTWTESGSYSTPGGQESVKVTLTAKAGTVTAVKVTGSGGTPNSQQYQSAFTSGISSAVVGKPLATLKVGAVSGSSLTGNGFNAAVEKIRADAA